MSVNLSKTFLPMSSKKPITYKEHTADCGMECVICTTRCYYGYPGHYYPCANGDCQCDCGEYKNISEELREQETRNIIQREGL